MHFRMRGEHSYIDAAAHGVTYQTSFQVETMEPETFRHVHESWLADLTKGGPDAPGLSRTAIAAASPVSYIDVAKPGCLFVLAPWFPTSDGRIKSQTLVEPANGDQERHQRRTRRGSGDFNGR